MPRSRLRAFITRWPIEPATQATSAAVKACQKRKGVMKDSSAPTKLATTMPTPQLAQLKLRLMWGAIGARGRSSWRSRPPRAGGASGPASAGGAVADRRRLMRCCTNMQVCTVATRKKTRNAFFPS